MQLNFTKDFIPDLRHKEKCRTIRLCKAGVERFRYGMDLQFYSGSRFHPATYKKFGTAKVLFTQQLKIGRSYKPDGYKIISSVGELAGLAGKQKKDFYQLDGFDNMPTPF